MWEAFKDIIFAIIQFFYYPFNDWGMSIIIVTIIFRLCLGPLMRSQTKSSYQMQKIQPLILEIQQRYANDQVRQQEELQKIYAEAHFNPLAGCLPLLLQMPIFIALFQVLQEMGTRVGDANYSWYNIVPNLVYTPGDTFGMGFAAFFPNLVLLIVFAGATFLPMLLQLKNTGNSQQRNQTLIMSGIMTIFMIWIGWSSPAGVLLFWGASSLIGVLQQQLTMHKLKKQDEEEEKQEVSRPVKVEVERKTKKKRPTKKR